VRAACALLVMLLAGSVSFLSAATASVQLRGAACLSSADGPIPPLRAPVRCVSRSQASSDPGAWRWLRLDAAAMADVPAEARLLVTQSRFDRIALAIVTRSGEVRRTAYDRATVASLWAPGGELALPIGVAGRDIVTIALGFRGLDDPALVRVIHTATDVEFGKSIADWYLLMGVFGGAMMCAFLYNLFIAFDQRYAFQHWYLAWVAVSFAYGAIWSNMAALAVPWLIGPVAMTINYVLVGLMVFIGTRLFLSLIEEGLLPERFQRFGRAVAGAGAVLGVVAILPGPLAPLTTDGLLNMAVLASSGIALAGTLLAAARGSRTIWFYTIGWWPVLVVAVLRVIRNVGYMPQTPMLDMAMFGTISFEAVILSLALAYRVRLLRRELQIALRARELAQVEQETLRRAAHTDFLTGLGNRAAFQTVLEHQARAGAPEGFTLILVDIDNLKQVNDGFGHAAGDAMLVQCAARMRALMPCVQDAGATATRLGGDEFALIVPGARNRAVSVLHGLASIQDEPWRHGDHAHPLSFSSGSAHFPDDAVRLDLLYRHADTALYAAKRQARARIAVPSPVIMAGRHDPPVAATG
jgi:diguanylate cyclase (GGDEF)-like protein